VGYEEGGQLTEAIRRRPYAVVLFDEIEKAHPDVFNILLQILDDGRLTDGQGRVVSFRNTVIIMTSNVGSQWIKELGPERARDMVMDELSKQFRPEFLNRIDEIIIFRALSREDLNRIVDIQLRGLQKNLAQRRITLEVTEAAKQKLADEGFDPVYGARPLKRVIQKRIQNRLAMMSLQGQIKDGQHVVVDVTPDGEIEFRAQPVEQAVPV
jgi:ATP-dependent Clp protease ATP-binding subunit ClpB